MANPYKTIGNTAAAVVSILAIGTALWFQRTPGPINAPRPQDEAEIMTAILERHHAMGRTFANFYKSVWNGRLQTNITEYIFVNSITFSNGASSTTNHYFLGNTNPACYYDIPPTGVYSVAMSWYSGDLSIGMLHSGGQIVASTNGGGYLVSGGPDCESMIQWYSVGIGTEFLPLLDGVWDNPTVWGSYDYSYSTTNFAITNVVKLYDSETNTIGFFPNAPFRYASGMRSAFLGGNTSALFVPWSIYRLYDVNLQVWFIPGYGTLDYTPPQAKMEEDSCLGVNREAGWIIPEDAYMQTGDTSWFGTMVHTNIFGGPLNYWSGWDPIMSWFYGSSWNEFADKFFARSQFVWTNYVTKCDSTWRTTTNYATSYVTNRVVGSVTNTITNTTFSTTNYVATGNANTYVHGVGDFFENSECVSMMFPFERDTPGIIRVDAHSSVEGAPADKYSPAFWSTNVYNDMGRAISLLQWVRDYRQPTTNVSWMLRYTNGTLQEASSTTGFSVASPHIETYIYVSAHGGGRTNSWAWGTTVLYDFTNQTPFNLDTILFQPTYYTNANAGSYSNGPATISTVLTNSSGSSGWWPLDPDALRTLLDNHARTATTTSTGMYFHANIPYDCYHVQFSALTNYLNHAPAR